MNKMRARDSRLSARATFMHDLVACFDRFLHYLATSDRQWPYAAPGQIPQPFVVIAGVKKNHALACGRVVKRNSRIFGDQRKACLPTRTIGFIINFLAKLITVYNLNYS